MTVLEYKIPPHDHDLHTRTNLPFNLLGKEVVPSCLDERVRKRSVHTTNADFNRILDFLQKSIVHGKLKLPVLKCTLDKHLRVIVIT